MACPECDGKTVVTLACRCRDGDGQFLVDAGAPARVERAQRRPWPDCEVCHGAGSVTSGCYDCGRTGRLRAQIVYTVANLDTGQVASANLVPGAVEPVRTPAGRWLLPLGSLIVELAARADTASTTLHEPDVPQRPIQPELYDIHLPRDWRPDLPTDRRHALESQSIARGVGRAWVVLLGHAQAPPPPDHDRMLGRLCALADDLHLDLVVDARPHGRRTGLAWQIRHAHPGAPLPATVTGTFADLPATIAATTVEQAAAKLDTPTAGVPALYLNPHHAPDEEEIERPLVPDVDQLERRIIRDTQGTAGAQAIWRDRRWWHTNLQPSDPTETLMESETGQVVRRTRATLRRAWEPPGPRCRGEAIPASRCHPCAGTGIGAHQMPCQRCRELGRIHHGAVLSITDLRGRHLHLNWSPDDRSRLRAALVATYPSGIPVLQLPAHYRVGRWASHFDVRPEDLTTLDGENVIGQDLRDGIVHLIDPTADPVRYYLTAAATGRPAGRIIVRAHDWAGPGLADLARVALGLGLAIDITTVNHRLDAGDPHLVQGVRWAVDLVHPDTAIGPTEPHHRGVPEAVAYCLRYLGGALRAALPPAPTEPFPSRNNWHR